LKAILVALLLALGALAVVPSAEATQPPPPCGSADYACPTPACRQTQVDQDTVLAVIGALGPWGMVYTGPLFGARLNSDCTVDAWETRLDCWPTVLPLAYQEQPVDGGRVDATVGYCGVGFICACMPAGEVSSAEPPSPCGPTALCEGPTCTPLDAVTTGLPVQGEVRIDGDCTANVSEAGTPCAGPTAPGSVHADGPASVSAATCRLDADCTCDPLPIDPTTGAALSLPPIFQPCPGMGGCCGVEPPEGGCGGLPNPPSVPPCPEKGVSTTDLFGFLGPVLAAAVHSDCTASVGETGLPCPQAAPDRGSVDRSAGPVSAHADTCAPTLDCTCDPILAPLATQEASSSAIQPPVTVEFPVCVTDPCPPKVTCHVAPRAVAGVVTVTVGSDCHVTVTEEPLVTCEGLRSESATVGPVTVVRYYCGPGIDP
jgi:hypothetical protein